MEHGQKQPTSQCFHADRIEQDVQHNIVAEHGRTLELTSQVDYASNGRRHDRGFDGWIDRRIYGRIYGWLHGRIDWGVHRWIDWRFHGWIDWRVHGRSQWLYLYVGVRMC
jgi:hypothetical protein